MAGTLTRSVLLKIRSDDGDTQEKLDEITAKADRLKELNPDIKVRVETAEASAKMALLRDELKATAKNAKVTVDENGGSSKGGLIGRLLYGADFAEGGGSGSGDVGGLAGMAPDLSPMMIAIGAAIPLVLALAAELTGLISGLAAAGAGAGAFAALAYPAFEKVKGAMSDTAAQLAKLSPDERGAVLGIRGLKTEYEKMAKAFEPEAFKVFNAGLKDANELLPAITPFADTFATSLTGLLKQVGKFADSKGFKDWLTQFQKLEGPSVKAIGDGIGRIATNFGKLLTSMSAKDVVHAINIAFDVLSGTIKGLDWVVTHLMHSWDELTTFVDAHVTPMIKDLISWTGRFAERNRQDFDQAVTDTEHWASNVSKFIGNVVTWFKELPGKIVSAIGDLAGLLERAGANAISGLISGMRSMVGQAVSDAAGWGHDIVSAIGGAFGIHFSEPSEATKMIQAGRNIATGLGAGIRAGTPAASAAATSLAHAAMLGGGRGGGLAGAGGPVVVTLEFQGADQALVTALKKIIRVRGGDPNVLGR
jgi:hypothetical protein